MGPVAILISPIWTALSSTFLGNLVLQAGLTFLATRLIKPPTFEVPEPANVRVTSREPASARTITYGDAWMSPKVVDEWNSRNQSSVNRGDTPAGYTQLLAVAEHQVECLMMKVNGEQLLDWAEQDRLRTRDGVLAVKGQETQDFPRLTHQVGAHNIVGLENRRFTPTQSGGFFGYNKPTRVRRDISDRVRRGVKAIYVPRAENNGNPTAIIISKLLGNTTAVNDRWVYDAAVPAWDELYFEPMLEKVYRDVFQNLEGNDLVNPFSTRFFLRNATVGHGSGARISNNDYGIRGTGTSMMMMHFPINTEYKEGQVPPWVQAPNILMLMRRRREWLTLWDDPELKKAYEAAGITLPEINPLWQHNNAALCLFDYLMRYTPYREVLGGYARVDLASVARAAHVCHERGHYYPIDQNDNYGQAADLWNALRRERPELFSSPSAAQIAERDKILAERRASTTIRRRVYNPDYALTANGAVNTENAPLEVMRQFQYAMVGQIVERGGILHVFAGERGAATHSYHEGDMIEDSWSLETGSERSQRPGIIDINYPDFAGERQDVAFSYPDARENLKATPLSLSFVNNLQQARRVGFVENHRAWESAKVAFEIPPHVVPPDAHDLINIDIPSIQVAGVFRVVTREEDLAGGKVTVVAESERADLYDVPLDNTFIPSPRTAPLLYNADGEVDEDWLVVTKSDGSSGELIFTRADGSEGRMLITRTDSD